MRDVSDVLAKGSGGGSNLTHTHQPRPKNTFYPTDKSTGISREKDEFLLKETCYVGLCKGDFEQHNEIFSH